MRNPLNRRSRDETKPTLRERFAATKAKAAGLVPETSQGRRAMLAGSVAAVLPLPALAASGPILSDGRADYLARLLTAYAEDRAARPISNTAEFNSIEDEASRLVLRRCRDVYVEILALPPPQATDGLALAALAAAIALEVSLDRKDIPQPEALAAVVATRALLAITGTALPPGFSGFGDEPDCSERDAALFDGPGNLPAWAIAAAEAADEGHESDATA